MYPSAVRFDVQPSREHEACMSASRETTADAVLEICERICREEFHTVIEPTKEDAQFMADSLRRWQKVLQPALEISASSQTQSGACDRLVRESVAMRVERCGATYKNGVRQMQQCMRCGVWEKCCMYRVSLVGYGAGFHPNPEVWMEGNIADLGDEYENVRELIDTVFEGNLVRQVRMEEPLQLHTIDYGDLMVGEQCLRRMINTFQLSHFLQEKIYDADVRLKAYRERGFELDDRELYTCHGKDEDACERFVEEVDDLLERARNDCKTVPLCFYGWDRGFFAIIDEARQAACNGVGDRLAKMVGDRAYKLMEDKGMGWRLNRESLQPPDDTLEDEEYDSDEERFIVSDEDGEGEEYHGGGPRNEGTSRGNTRVHGSVARKKRRAIAESEDDEEEEAEVAERSEKVCRGAGRRRSKRQRGMEPEEEEEEEEEVGRVGRAPGGAAHSIHPHAQRHMRVRPSESLVSHRAEGGSSKRDDFAVEDLVTDLIRLTHRMRSNRPDVCSEWKTVGKAALVIEELKEKLEARASR